MSDKLFETDKLNKGETIILAVCGTVMCAILAFLIVTPIVLYG